VGAHLACLGYAVVRVLGLERGFPLVPLIAGLVALALAGLVAPRALGGPSPTA
jgi:hypothetical protein